MMGLFFGRKKTRRAEKQVDVNRSEEVDRIKRDTFMPAEEAKRKAEQLHAVLMANNISVQITRATRSHRGN